MDQELFAVTKLSYEEAAKILADNGEIVTATLTDERLVDFVVYCSQLGLRLEADTHSHDWFTTLRKSDIARIRRTNQQWIDLEGSP